jgi:hypothetical protein
VIGHSQGEGKPTQIAKRNLDLKLKNIVGLQGRRLAPFVIHNKQGQTERDETVGWPQAIALDKIRLAGLHEEHTAQQGETHPVSQARIQSGDGRRDVQLTHILQAWNQQESSTA